MTAARRASALGASWERSFEESNLVAPLSASDEPTRQRRQRLVRGGRCVCRAPTPPAPSAETINHPTAGAVRRANLTPVGPLRATLACVQVRRQHVAPRLAGERVGQRLSGNRADGRKREQRNQQNYGHHDAGRRGRHRGAAQAGHLTPPLLELRRRRHPHPTHASDRHQNRSRIRRRAPADGLALVPQEQECAAKGWRGRLRL